MDIDTIIIILVLSTIVGILNGIAIMSVYYKIQAKRMATASMRLKRYVDMDALVIEMYKLKQELNRLKYEKKAVGIGVKK